MKYFIVSFLLALGVSFSNEVYGQQQPKGTIYRCDGCSGGITSEYFQIELNKDYDKVVNIWYWNTTNAQPMIVKIVEQNYVEGEISGFTLTINFAGSKDKYYLGLIEDQANLSDDNGMFKEYRIEQ